MAEPVTLAEAKAQVNMVNDNSQDTFLTSLIAPARATVERSSRFFWVAASRTETFGAWGEALGRLSTRGRGQYLEIYRRPIVSVDEVAYLDVDGNAATYGAFIASLDRFPVWISPAVDGEFPALGRGGSITVSYTSGALASTDEEYLIGKRAMLLLIGHWFENREAVIADLRAAVADVPWAVTDLLDAIRPVSAY